MFLRFFRPSKGRVVVAIVLTFVGWVLTSPRLCWDAIDENGQLYGDCVLMPGVKDLVILVIACRLAVVIVPLRDRSGD